MFDHGVFALPAIYPAVPRGQAVIRTAYMSTHKDSQIKYVLEILEKLAKKHRIRACDFTQPDSAPEEWVYHDLSRCQWHCRQHAWRLTRNYGGGHA